MITLLFAGASIEKDKSIVFATLLVEVGMSLLLSREVFSFKGWALGNIFKGELLCEERDVRILGSLLM